jgi:hypothetical protein
MAVDVNIPATGALGAPPPGAPVESSQPLQPDAGSIVVFDRETGRPTGEIVDPAARAAANERELQPLTYGKVEPSAVAPESNVPGKRIGGLDPFYQQQKQMRDEAASAASPAASNSDSPSRGLPTTVPVPASRKRAPLQSTGGFGSAGDAQYFPLTGDEARTLAQELMDRLNDRLKNDLRFSMAICYPRVSLKLQLIVEAEAGGEGNGFVIEYVTAHDKTPLEVAKEYGDSVVFVLREQRREFDDAGNVETPADAIRDELGILKPKKQLVQMGGGKQFADVPLGW